MNVLSFLTQPFLEILILNLAIISHFSINWVCRFSFWTEYLWDYFENCNPYKRSCQVHIFMDFLGHLIKISGAMLYSLTLKSTCFWIYVFIFVKNTHVISSWRNKVISQYKILNFDKDIEWRKQLGWSRLKISIET